MTYVIGGRSAILPADRYYNSMEARLHIFDGNGLKQYRMVHETWADQTHEVLYKQIYNLISQSNIPTVDTGYVKVFEYVKGAKLKGTALPNETIKISTTIFTGQNRTFEYSQSTTADFKGNYEFIVPYSSSIQSL
jgi:dolichyl-diphosphooligosaccharide--protein glycosyltransferase